MIEPLARVLQPNVYGIERIPDRGVLFVGNHTLYGLIDVPFMVAELWKREIQVRPLGDHGHYAIPVWRNLLEMCGMVHGKRGNVRVLMREGQNVLVYPGGADEVFRQPGERYRLKGQERLGFASLAIEFGYPVIPFAAVGVEARSCRPSGTPTRVAVWRCAFAQHRTSRVSPKATRTPGSSCAASTRGTTAGQLVWRPG